MNDRVNLSSKHDLAWGLVAQILQLGLWAVLLPFILLFLSLPMISLWLIFLAMLGLSQLLELGFQNVLTRSFSNVYAGGQTLLPSGLHQAAGKLNILLLHTLIKAAKRIYLVISLLTAFIFGVGGSFYLCTIMPEGVDELLVIGSWGLFVASCSINFYFGFLNSVIIGRGEITKSNQIIVAAKFTQLCFSLVFVWLGMSLLGLGIASLLSTLVSRFLSYRLTFNRARPELQHLAPDISAVSPLVKILWHNASRYGLALVGAFLLSRATILIAASQIGVIEGARYSLSLQLLLVLQAVAQLPFNLLIPRINRLNVIGSREEATSVFAGGLVSSMLFYLAMAMPLVAFGNLTLKLLGVSSQLMSVQLLIVMAIAMFLELVQGISANFIATRNEVPFVSAALVTGAAVAIISWHAAALAGVAGLVFTTAFCQLVYNNWKWPLEAARAAGHSFPNILIIGLRSLSERFIHQDRIFKGDR